MDEGADDVSLLPPNSSVVVPRRPTLLIPLTKDFESLSVLH